MRKLFREALKYHVDDYPGSETGKDIYLFDELPTDVSMAEPDLLLIVPLIYGSVSFMRDCKREEFINVQRARKNARSEIYDDCINPINPSDAPIKKTTEKAIEAYTEKQDSMQERNREYDSAEAELQLYMSGCKTIDMYNENLKLFLKLEDKDEYVSKAKTHRTERTSSAERVIKEKELERVRRPLKRKGVKIKKKKRPTITDPDLD